MGATQEAFGTRAGWDRLRTTFTEDAERYDQARPGYPEGVYDDLAELSGVSPGGRVLEIGCGTGQATLPLLRRGWRVTAVELGAAMAAVARRRVAAFPGVEVHTAPFEAWPLPKEPFDLVVAATAFHWVDPAVRWRKAAEALRPGGAVALFASRHVAGGDQAFFDAAQTCYQRHAGTPAGQRVPRAEEVPDTASDLAACGLFEPPAFRRYLWEATYSADEFLRLLGTYSDHRALPPAQRQALFACLAALIDGRFGGRIRKAYLTQLLVARRR